MAENGRRVSDLVVATIAREVANAKAGSIDAVAMIIIDPSGRPRIEFGGDMDLAPSIYFGAGLLMASLEGKALNMPDAVKPHSGLIVPKSN